jgi:hypothetical protein
MQWRLRLSGKWQFKALLLGSFLLLQNLHFHHPWWSQRVT